jgi:hypothetical protein
MNEAGRRQRLVGPPDALAREMVQAAEPEARIEAMTVKRPSDDCPFAASLPAALHFPYQRRGRERGNVVP